MPRVLATALPAFLAVLLGGAAAPALAQANAQPAVADAQSVTIHESMASTTARYEIIKRLWIESWRIPLVIPRYDSRETAIAAFREHAVRLGGNGVINFGCYQLPGVSGSGSRLSCNGTIVRFL